MLTKEILNKNKICVKISDKTYTYGEYLLKKHGIEKNIVENNINYKEYCLDGVFVHYLIKELFLSDFYRVNFILYNLKCDKFVGGVIFLLIPTKYDLIDYNWNFRVSRMVREQCELEHALSWLSTLGGAFSALGDYYSNCADIAGRISSHQLKLAFKLGDPNIAARCNLYYSLSLIQQRKFREAKKIVFNIYEMAKNRVFQDYRLPKMCKGIWSKLQHEYSLHVNSQYREKIINKAVKYYKFVLF
ncbi:unnamed protein product [Brassicogethes aeneus]|uniref:Uncharacterized protein n=1 Tax=Brassicogethes aeneus TaxID=1431903 RepID=A0A9P0AWW0_BRAAE|nr:unnamed protein product [Brassicogethes aeneus]